MSRPGRPQGDGPPVNPTDATPDDPYLSQALRHAPDAQHAPPPALTAAILREARAAVAPAAHRPPSPEAAERAWWQPMADLWRQLSRPPVAAAMASLMVATTLGLLWRDGAMDEPFPAETPVAATAPAPAVRPSSPRLAEVSPNTPRALAPTVPTMPTAPAAPAPERPAVAAEPAPAAATTPSRQPASPGPIDGIQARPPQRLSAPPPPEGSVDTPPAPAVATKAAAPDPAPARAADAMPTPPVVAAVEAPRPAPAPLRSVIGAAAGPPAEPAARQERTEAATAPAAAPVVPFAAAPPAPAAPATLERSGSVGRLAGARGIAADTSGSELAAGPLAQQLRSEMPRWQQARNGGEARPADESLVAWLTLLAADADRGDASWQRVTAPTPPLAEGRQQWLTLLRDGTWVHRFVLEGEQLRWERNARGARLLLASPEVVRRLGDRLP